MCELTGRFFGIIDASASDYAGKPVRSNVWFATRSGSDLTLDEVNSHILAAPRRERFVELGGFLIKQSDDSSEHQY